MDHNEAVRLQAAEKYVLGEFPADLRDEYEEHFFDCAECAVDVKAIAALRMSAGKSCVRNLRIWRRRKLLRLRVDG